ncbi:hypothetical protein NX059_002144 [Plenodomus lindquistii]|nr:hypothetical protein NX059_002144 [Plenodomus lindquistii]
MRYYEHARYKRDGDAGVDYSYFGVQMAAIHEEIQNPTPHPDWDSWLQKYSGQRYMLMATMIGVFIAVTLGVLSLGVSAFQAWISWQQWKHPIQQD